MTHRSLLVIIACAACALGSLAYAQEDRPASPEGTAATQIGGRWIDISYGRPILRGRTNIFGSGADYGKGLNDGAPVWRAGANRTTMLRTESALEIGGKRVPAGEYAVLVELKGDRDWTLILSAQPHQRAYSKANTTDLWGSYNYTPARDVARAPMRVETIPFSIDQLTWGFTDVSAAGGTLRLWWARNMASVPFKVVS
jgi:hypothetical protein